MAKKTTKKKAQAKKSSAKKKPTQQSVAKKSTTKKATTKKKSTRKQTTQAASVKKKSTKKPTKKTSVKKSPTKKAATTTAAKSAVKAAVKSKPEKPAEPTLEELLDRDWTIPQLKRVKTGMTKKDLDYFLQLLLEKRSEIIGNVQGMEDARSAALGDIAHMPLHMADVGSDNYEQEFTLGLMESEREMLREIEAAIVRMREGYYGVCLDSGQPINRARLEIKPWAKYCIEVARMREKRGW